MNSCTTRFTLVAAFAAGVMSFSTETDASVSVYFEGTSTGPNGAGAFSFSFELDTDAAPGFVDQYDASFSSPGIQGRLNAAAHADTHANITGLNSLGVFQGSQAGPFSSYGLSLQFEGLLDTGETYTATAELLTFVSQIGSANVWWQGVDRELGYFGGTTTLLFPTMFDSDNLPTDTALDFTKLMELTVSDGNTYSVTRIYAVPAPATAATLVGVLGFSRRRRR